MKTHALAFRLDTGVYTTFCGQSVVASDCPRIPLTATIERVSCRHCDRHMTTKGGSFSARPLKPEGFTYEEDA